MSKSNTPIEKFNIKIKVDFFHPSMLIIIIIPLELKEAVFCNIEHNLISKKL